MANMLLVGHAGQATGARQHTEQRHLGQADRAAAVVDQDDLVAGQRQLITAASASAVDGGQELQTTVLAGILQPVAGLVGELAEVHLPRVAGNAEHEDVGTGAKHFFLGAGHDHAAHLGMLEADAVDRIVQLDIHTQVIAVELELVARAQTGVLVEIGHQRGHRAVEAQLPVPVLRGVGLVFDAAGGAHGPISEVIQRNIVLVFCRD